MSGAAGLTGASLMAVVRCQVRTTHGLHRRHVQRWRVCGAGIVRERRQGRQRDGTTSHTKHHPKCQSHTRVRSWCCVVPGCGLRWKLRAMLRRCGVHAAPAVCQWCVHEQPVCGTHLLRRHAQRYVAVTRGTVHSHGAGGTLTLDTARWLHCTPGAESDVDCGGEGCDACAAGLVCGSDVDCLSGTCLPSTGRCGAAASCSNGVQDEGEAGVDCGGPCEACVEAGNSPWCGDGVHNGDESDVDCGGSW